MCGQLFSFQGQLNQHKIVHWIIKTHKCMAKDCGRWFMRKADLTVHAETHNKKEYKCDKCESFTTRLRKYWKEHMKGHEAVLPYACSLCEKHFLYQQTSVLPQGQRPQGPVKLDDILILWHTKLM